MNRLKKAGLSILISSLAGCGGTQVIKEPQLVNVAVPVKCEPTLNITEIRDYPTDHFTEDMDLYDKAKLVIAELKLVKGQNTELKAALAECTKPVETKKTAP